MNMEDLYRTYGVSTAPDSHKHSRRGWLQTECMFCTGTHGYHLGWHINSKYYNCWRCGWHSTYDVLLHIIGDAKITQTYTKKIDSSKPKDDVKEKYKQQALTLKLPFHTALSKEARRYLRGRRFNPSELVTLWGLVSGHYAAGMYQHRIVAPINFNNQLVSFQTRDVSGRKELRYKACPQADEVIQHQHLLYGADYTNTDTVVVVEGLPDVWRLGYGAVGTFGIDYTQSQVRLLSTYENRIILFDTPDKQAVRKGKQLAEELSCYKGTTEYVRLTGKYAKCDPADLPKAYARALMHELKG